MIAKLLLDENRRPHETLSPGSRAVLHDSDNKFQLSEESKQLLRNKVDANQRAHIEISTDQDYLEDSALIEPTVID